MYYTELYTLFLWQLYFRIQIELALGLVLQKFQKIGIINLFQSIISIIFLLLKKQNEHKCLEFILKNICIVSFSYGIRFTIQWLTHISYKMHPMTLMYRLSDLITYEMYHMAPVYRLSDLTLVMRCIPRLSCTGYLISH